MTVLEGPPPVPLRVAIIGAGIGGLTLAAALICLFSEMGLSQSIQVEIFEQKDELSTIGTGIVMYRRAWDILRRIGLVHELEKYLEEPLNDDIRLAWKHKIANVGDNCVNLFEYYVEGGMPCFHRSSVQEVLLKGLSPKYKCHLSHCFVSYEETAHNVVLNFADGTTAECDLLVGADGLRSNLRKEYSNKNFKKSESIDPTWSGSLTYRSIVDATVLEQRFPQHDALKYPIKYCGNNQIVVYPIGQDHLNVSVVVSDHEKDGTSFEGACVMSVSKGHIVSQFDGWSVEARAVLELIPDECRRWPIQYLKPLMDFGKGRVVILGDAAHAMTPNQGAGAGQAMEDAYVLARLISKSIRQKIPLAKITEVYSKVRPPVANAVMEGSAKSGRIVEQDYHRVDYSDLDAVKRLRDSFEQQFMEHYSWCSWYPLEAHIKKSLDML